MKKIFLRIVIAIIAIGLGYLVSVTIVDAILMGMAYPRFDGDVNKESYLIEDGVRIDSQTEFRCSAFSSAYVMRHWGTETHGDSIYDIMPDKMDNGYVYPKGITHFLESKGYDVGYHMGNLAALKNEVAKGHPVIVMIKIREDKDWLHYVPIVGYTPDSVYIAESIPELANATAKQYNRSISTEDFKKLWNTSAFKMPLYRNTFFTITKN